MILFNMKSKSVWTWALARTYARHTPPIGTWHGDAAKSWSRIGTGTKSKAYVWAESCGFFI